MSEQAGLLQAICQQAEDDTPRLVYADWLEDHDDPLQAEYIRAQVELARVSEHEALAIRAARGVRDRNAAPDHRPPPPSLPDGMRWGPYRRGFPWELQVFDVAEFCREAPRLFEQAPIQALDIDARHLRDIAPLTVAPWLARVVRLQFSLGRFGDSMVAQLIDSPFLGRLAELGFAFDGILPGGLRRLLTSELTGRLRTLNLHSNFFVQHGISLGQVFQVASQLPLLGSLDLSGNRVSHGSLWPLLERQLTPALRALDLGGNQLDVASLLADAPALPRLETLRLAKTVPGPAGVRAIVSAPQASDLRGLYLGSNRLGPLAVKHLARAETLAGLRVLDLSDNPVTDSGATALADSPHLSGLLAINLRRAAMGDAGARALLDAPALSGLIHLDLHDNAFSPAIVKQVRDRFGRFSASDPQYAHVRRRRGKNR
jgi:uncharacterized protein (TIGR02996 family)